MRDIKNAKIAVVGIGGVGGYLGAMLAANLPNVTLVARGARLTAIRENGLTLHSDRQGEVLARPAAVVTTAELEEQDYIFVCVKNYSLAATCAEIAHAVGDDTVIIPVMNGVDPGERVRAALPSATVIDSLIYVVAFANADYSITQQGKFDKIYIGKTNATETEKEHLAVVDAILSAGNIDHSIADDIEAAIWKKYILNCAYNVATAYYNLPIGALRSDKALAAEYEALVREAYAVSQAKGIHITPAEADKIINRFYTGYADDATSSLMRDVAAGKRAELDTFSGYIVREAEKYGIAAPVSQKMYAGLKEKAVTD